MARLNPRETIFVLEYVIDWDHRRAALAAGYPNANWGARVMKKYAVQEAIREEKESRKERLRVDGDKLTEEYAKVAFANARDYVPRTGEIFDIHRLDVDRSAAIEHVDMKETVDPITHEVRRELRVKMHDKIAALNSLAKSIGMLTERHVIEGTIEHVIAQMTPSERLERVEQLRLKAKNLYLPQYQTMQQMVDVTPDKVSVANSVGVDVGGGGDESGDGDVDVGIGVGAGEDVSVGDGDDEDVGGGGGVGEGDGDSVGDDEDVGGGGGGAEDNSKISRPGKLHKLK